MRVTAVYKDYPEKNLRKRKWLSVQEAAKKVSIPEVAKMIRKMNQSKKSK